MIGFIPVSAADVAVPVRNRTPEKVCSSLKGRRHLEFEDSSSEQFASVTLTNPIDAKGIGNIAPSREPYKTYLARMCTTFSSHNIYRKNLRSIVHGHHANHYFLACLSIASLQGSTAYGYTFYNHATSDGFVKGMDTHLGSKQTRLTSLGSFIHKSTLDATHHSANVSTDPLLLEVTC